MCCTVAGGGGGGLEGASESRECTRSSQHRATQLQVSGVPEIDTALAKLTSGKSVDKDTLVGIVEKMPKWMDGVHASLPAGLEKAVLCCVRDWLFGLQKQAPKSASGWDEFVSIARTCAKTIAPPMRQAEEYAEFLRLSQSLQEQRRSADIKDGSLKAVERPLG